MKQNYKGNALKLKESRQILCLSLLRTSKIQLRKLITDLSIKIESYRTFLTLYQHS